MGIIQGGMAEVFIADPKLPFPGKKVAELQQGDYFGDGALMRNEPRNATVKASAIVQAIKITREKFEELGLAKAAAPTDKRLSKSESSRSGPSGSRKRMSKMEQAVLDEAVAKGILQL